jgi:hypothetical protein
MGRWTRRRAPKRLAETSGDYPIPVADAAELLDELRVMKEPSEPTIDPSYCCERCEHLTGLIQQAGGARALDDALAAWFTAQMEAIHR